MKVKFKKLSPDAVTPCYAKPGDAAMDLTAISKEYKSHINEKFAYIEMGTGLAIEIPQGYVGLIFPRSSASNYSNVLTNSVGVIDSGYRGEIKFRFKTVGSLNEYKVGDRVGQLMIIPYPQVEMVEVNELSDSDRGVGGFGSSGK